MLARVAFSGQPPDRQVVLGSVAAEVMGIRSAPNAAALAAIGADEGSIADRGSDRSDGARSISGAPLRATSGGLRHAGAGAFDAPPGARGGLGSTSTAAHGADTQGVQVGHRGRGHAAMLRVPARIPGPSPALRARDEDRGGHLGGVPVRLSRRRLLANLTKNRAVLRGHRDLFRSDEPPGGGLDLKGKADASLVGLVGLGEMGNMGAVAAQKLRELRLGPVAPVPAEECCELHARQFVVISTNLSRAWVGFPQNSRSARGMLHT